MDTSQNRSRLIVGLALIIAAALMLVVGEGTFLLPPGQWCWACGG